jgi:hypothetical protein
MQAVDVESHAQLQTYVETDDESSDGDADVSKNCAGCGKLPTKALAMMYQKNCAPPGVMQPQTFCVPDCVPPSQLPRCVNKLYELLKQSETSNQKLRKYNDRLKGLKEDNEGLKRKVEQLQNINKVIVNAHHKKTHVLERVKQACEKSKKCETCITAVSIARSGLPNEGGDASQLHEISDVHPICIGENTVAFCTTCRGLEPPSKRGRNESLPQWVARFHAPTVKIMPLPTEEGLPTAKAWHPLTLRFDEQPVAKQTNDLKQSS